MSHDIHRILEGWDYDPNELSARIIKGDDGREKVQVRLDMGLMQMDASGSPDGSRPRGFESWLDYYEDQQRKHDRAHPDGASFALDDEDCTHLLREGIQYYHRYLSFWHLERYDECQRDTARNLRLFRFVRSAGTTERHKRQFDQWRPYVTRMYTKAVATPLIGAGELQRAIEAIDEGIDAVWEFLEDYGQTQRADDCAEFVELRQWRDEIEAMRAQRGENDELLREPGAPIAQLKQDLEKAVAAEQFEEAARLRDEIRRRSPADPPPASG